MRKRTLLTVFMGMGLLAIGTLTACENGEEATGLEAEAAIALADERGVEGHLGKLQETLDLSDAQVAELRAIFEEQHETLRALHEGAPEDHEARHAAFREQMAEVHERMSAVLTEEQRQRLEEHVRSRAGSGGPRGGWHRGS